MDRWTHENSNGRHLRLYQESEREMADENIFDLTRRKRTEALAEVLNRTSNTTPGRIRFTLAGVVASMDAQVLQYVARVVADEMQKSALRMKD